MRLKSRTIRWWQLTALAVSVILLATVMPADAGGGRHNITFERRGPGEESPSGNSVLADCLPGDRETADGWPLATARAKISQWHGRSQVTIKIRHARPNTYYTVWLRLGGTDSAGRPFGTNPVTGGKATPLAATDDLPALLSSTGPGNGNDNQPNGFRTDANGNARFSTRLDFPIDGGAYPFQRFADWDPNDDRLPAPEPAIYPVAIAGPQGPYTLRIVSHCTDDVGHGLQSGPREWWFDWTIDQ